MRRRIAWFLFCLSCAGVIYFGARFFSALKTGQDLVELRNSLLVEVRPDDPYVWSPNDVPRDFLWETAVAPAIVQEASERFDPGKGLSDLQRIISISRQLGSKKPSGDATQSTTVDALGAILRSSDGYCADYTQVLNALALAADIPIREWGMSFDGYGGAGHAFSEIYDSSRQKWIFVDSYLSFYVTDRDGVPLSVGEFRDRLVTQDYADIVVVPIASEKFRFKTLSGATDYYSRGSASFFMLWGNNVLSYDQTPVLWVARRFGRAVEQAVAIIVGVQPRIVIAGTWANKDGLAELETLRWLVCILLVSLLTFASTALYLLRSRSSRHGQKAPELDGVRANQRPGKDAI